jgi:hypothetical protein
MERYTAQVAVHTGLLTQALHQPTISDAQISVVIEPGASLIHARMRAGLARLAPPDGSR